MNVKYVKDLVGTAKLCALLPIALASVSLGVGAKLGLRAWTGLQSRLYAGLERPSSDSSTPRKRSTSPSTTSCSTGPFPPQSGATRSGASTPSSKN